MRFCFFGGIHGLYGVDTFLSYGYNLLLLLRLLRSDRIYIVEQTQSLLCLAKGLDS
jgi:hypothetical protein